MLPFLKKNQDSAMAGPVESQEREPDEKGNYDMLDAIADDLIQGVHKKDKELLKSALQAFGEHLQDMDVKQDQEIMKG